MPREEFKNAANNWKHWVVYSTITFLSIFVLVEFALSLSFFSILAPSNFMFYFTPVGFLFGEALVSLFASALLFLTLLLILRRRVYAKTDNSLKFSRSGSYLLLPFYLISIASLGIYISMIPLDLSNILTYLVFLILFESFIEHLQVSDYDVKIPKPLKISVPNNQSKSESEVNPGEVKDTLEELEKVTQAHVEKNTEEIISEEDLDISDEDFEQIIKDLYDIAGEGEKEVEAEMEKVLDKKRSVEELTRIKGVGKKRALKLYENGLETPQDIVDEGLESLAGIKHIGTKTAKKILKNAKGMEKSEKKKDEVEVGLEELENLFLDD